MADNLKKTGPADDKRVNVNQDHEIQYWTKKFDVSAVQLKAAVKKVGVMAADVKKELGK